MNASSKLSQPADNWSRLSLTRDDEHLLRKIEEDRPDLAKYLLSAFRTQYFDPWLHEETLAYLLRNSTLSAAVYASQANSVVTELFYANQKSPCFIDNHFLESQAGRSYRSRFNIIKELLHKQVTSRLEEQPTISITSIGSGPGRYITDVLAELSPEMLKNRVTAALFDIDENALFRAKLIAETKGLNNVQFRRADFTRKLPSYYKARFDVLVLQGVLCTYDESGCRMVLEHLRPMLTANGVIIATNVSTDMLTKDPFTCFLMERFMNWHMSFKSPAQVRQILEAAGLRPGVTTTDELGFHVIGVGHVDGISAFGVCM